MMMNGNGGAPMIAGKTCYVSSLVPSARVDW